MSRENGLNEIMVHHDYEYISNDPEENADNFDPKWSMLREMSTDEERYWAIRKRWGVTDIPDPQINLSFRHRRIETKLEKKENCVNPSSSSVAPPVSNAKRKKKVSRRLSRSCTRPYEELISNLRRNYDLKYSYLMSRHRAELLEMLQTQSQRAELIELLQVSIFSGYHNFKNVLWENMKCQEEKEVSHLLSHQFREIQSFLGEKNEHIDLCRKYMEEVRAFFTFYQKINDDEVTLQMTDEQYEHTVETEKMYCLYNKFYR